MNKLWLGMNLEDAIHDKVVFVSSDNSVLVERGFNEVDMISEKVQIPTVSLHYYTSDHKATTLLFTPLPFRTCTYRIVPYICTF